MQGPEHFALHIVDEFFWVVLQADRLSGTLLAAIVYFAEHAITKLPLDVEEPLQILFLIDVVIYGLVVLHFFDHTPKKYIIYFIIYKI